MDTELSELICVHGMQIQCSCVLMTNLKTQCSTVSVWIGDFSNWTRIFM